MGVQKKRNDISDWARVYNSQFCLNEKQMRLVVYGESKTTMRSTYKQMFACKTLLGSYYMVLLTFAYFVFFIICKDISHFFVGNS